MKLASLTEFAGAVLEVHRDKSETLVHSGRAMSSLRRSDGDIYTIRRICIVQFEGSLGNLAYLPFADIGSCYRLVRRQISLLQWKYVMALFIGIVLVVFDVISV